MAAPNLIARHRLLVWIGAASVLGVIAFVLVRRHTQAAREAEDNSGRPGPDLSGSAAQEPSGGAASVPGKMPAQFTDQPNTLAEQVQAADTTSPQSPQAITPPGWQTFTDPASGSTFTTDVGGQNAANLPTYNPSSGSWFEGALPAPASPAAPAGISASKSAQEAATKQYVQQLTGKVTSGF